MTNLTINPEQSKSMAALSHVSQDEGSSILEFNLSNGVILYVNQELVFDFIETNGLNVSCEYGGNSGIGEPWNDLPSIDLIANPADYLDANFDSVCLKYFTEVITKEGMKSKTLDMLERRIKELDTAEKLAMQDSNPKNLDENMNMIFRCTAGKVELMNIRESILKTA